MHAHKYREGETIINNDDTELLTWSIKQFRRTILSDFIYGMVQAFEDFDYSLPQMATLLFLDEQGDLTIKQVAEVLGRSMSATSRLLDQLVTRGMIHRRGDERDRRAKLVAITEQGRALIATLEQRRAEAQLSVMDYLSAEERVAVTRGMVLLAEAAQRRRAQHASSTTRTEESTTS
ncbi:hypothetical protein KDH_10280 [Dictyobacter sp. S3.2.2.5]|uniref:HTH marR-type domain-containing protein n=1 Tax=Dictyobacter halimunensis TaxID=3026934 RepID=A0ABQ6FJ22_9CHLR|nr:hypothetical protein KDH_10280 [Dictyobacter sp. S3.2.2.5]